MLIRTILLILKDLWLSRNFLKAKAIWWAKWNRNNIAIKNSDPTGQYL